MQNYAQMDPKWKPKSIIKRLRRRLARPGAPQNNPGRSRRGAIFQKTPKNNTDCSRRGAISQKHPQGRDVPKTPRNNTGCSRRGAVFQKHPEIIQAIPASQGNNIIWTGTLVPLFAVWARFNCIQLASPWQYLIGHLTPRPKVTSARNLRKKQWPMPKSTENPL